VKTLVVMKMGVLSAFGYAVAFAQSPTSTDPALFGENMTRWGRLERVVRPNYPPDALARGQKGVVDITGTIGGTGMLGDIKYMPQTPDASLFVEELEKVVAHWWFRPSMGNNCQPKPEPVKVRAEFEIENGEPRIFVTHSPGGAQRAPPPDSPATNWKVIKRIEPTYPRSMLAKSLEAKVYARVDVDPAGNVIAFSASAYPRGLFTRQARRVGTRLLAPVDLTPENEELRPFIQSTERALTEWKFTPAPEGWTRRRAGCYEINYQFSN
jgi:outer membrane biosynthesis protein TonB